MLIASEINQRIDTFVPSAKGSASLNLLVDGDSWFDYPLDGSSFFDHIVGQPLFGPHTDVIAQLYTLAQVKPSILNLAHYGNTSTQELGYTRQLRIRKAIEAKRPAAFDAIIMSGGGNDIAGDALCIWLNEASTVDDDPKRALNLNRLADALACIESSYSDLIALRDECIPGAPIFVHSYDYAQPTGKGACTMGPWLKPALDFCGWTNFDQGCAIVKTMMAEFAAMLDHLAADPANNVVHVKTQGTLSAAQWANELHPTPDGFKLIADRFVKALAQRFPARI